MNTRCTFRNARRIARWGVLLCMFCSGCQTIIGYEESKPRAASGSTTGGSGGATTGGSGGATTGGSAGATTGGSGGATTGGSGGAGALRCPGKMGPKMILLPIPNTTDWFCIDETEVTQDQYRKWVESGNAKIVDPRCLPWKPDIAIPECLKWKPHTDADWPAVCIDWCDALAFCKAAGKHLCGGLGTGDKSISANQGNDPEISQWYSACTSGGTQGSTWGDTPWNDQCIAALADPSDVYAKTACHSSLAPYDKVYGLNGNAAEWTDECEDVGNSNAGPPESVRCRLRGGGYNDEPGSLTCRVGAPIRRDSTDTHNGFRCCAEPIKK